MVGIVAYGGYVPKRRMDKKTIAKSMAWLEPSLFKHARGELAIANLDEDSLSIAVEAGADCLNGMDKNSIEGIYSASTSYPYIDRDNTDIIRCALNLSSNVYSADFTGSLKAGTSALLSAIGGVSSGMLSKALVVASENRVARPASASQLWFGDGGGAVAVGKDNVIAEYVGSYSFRDAFVDHYRGANAGFDYNWEERFMRDVGYMTLYPKLLTGLLKKTGISPQEVSKVLFPCVLGPGVRAKILKISGFNPECGGEDLDAVVGDCGAAQPLVMLVNALEKAEPGDKIIVASFGQGGDALVFEATDEIKKQKPKNGLSSYIANKMQENDYIKWLGFNGLINMDLGARAEVPVKASLSSHYRQHQFLLSLKGSKCKQCGTPQLPPARVCVKPECGAIDSYELCDFSNKTGKIVSFSTNTLTGSLQRQAIVGYVDFEGGGRLLMDLTDCDLSEIEVGTQVRPTFRKRWVEDRGFTAYFWKAIPIQPN